ncbi:ankyrin repeat domain-containing protein [Malikia spinosa]|uniref:ankyrin repeat domain-containing protein n=1 Tax=Malikia spinosa TaxID=86180 RepID=UPI00267DD6AF|nr:hypothetical protein [Malikia spinosa]
MKPAASIGLTWRRIARGLCFAFSLITGTIMMHTATAAPIFKLKPAGEYFDDPKALALLDAALAGDLKRAQALVASGANPQAEGPRQAINRIDLLDYAIAAGKPQAIRVLVAVGADPERIHQGPGNAFLFAMKLEKMDLYALLLDLKPVKSLSKDTLEYLMFEAVIEHCRPCLELLLKRGVPIDFPDGSGETVLLSAMSVQDYELAEWILLQGASVKIETRGGGTPANAVEFYLKKFRPGTPTHDQVLRLKALIQARGAVFPAPTPQEIRERRARSGSPAAQ